MWRACGRKKLSFEHEGQARSEAYHRKMKYYACRHCGRFHLSTIRGNGFGKTEQ